MPPHWNRRMRLSYCRICVYVNDTYYRTEQHGAEDAPELADLYLAYGKALLENAISTSDVLGKTGDKDGPEPEDGMSHVVLESALLTVYL